MKIFITQCYTFYVDNSQCRIGQCAVAQGLSRVSLGASANTAVRELLFWLGSQKFIKMVKITVLNVGGVGALRGAAV